MPATSGNRFLVGPRRKKKQYDTQYQKEQALKRGSYSNYDLCPNCQGIKSKVSKLCRTCSNNIGRSDSHSPSIDSYRMKNRNMVTGSRTYRN